MKQIFHSVREYCFLVLVLCFVTIVLFLPIASNTLIPGIWDLINHLVGILQAKMALGEGQVFLRTAPSGHLSTFRYPYFQFYSPTSYLIAGFIYRWIAPSSLFLAFKLTIGVALIVGGVYIYRLAYWLVKSRPAALLAAVVYLVAPYTIIVVDHLGNLNEAVALGVLPIVFFYTLRRYFNPEEDSNLLFTALAWYALATIHIITFVYTTICCVILLLLMTFAWPRRWKSLLHIGIAYAFGCMLATWYLAPVILYSKYLFITRVFLTSIDMVSLGSLLSPFCMFSAPSTSVFSQIHPSIGFPLLMAVALSLYLLLAKKIVNENTSKLIRCLLILFFIVLFVIWSPFDFWRWLPHSLGIIQYTWRLLGQTMWIGAILFAWCVCWIFDNKFNKKYVALGVIFIVLSTGNGLIARTFLFTNVDLIFNQPHELFNPDSYLVDFSKTGVDKIDFLKVASLHIGSGLVDVPGSLKVGPVVTFPQSMFNTAHDPVLEVNGFIPVSPSLKGQQLLFLANNHVIKTYDLTPGTFQWKIPLHSLVTESKNTLAALQFKMKNSKIAPDIKSDSIVLKGFLNPKTTLKLEQIPSACKQSQGDTVCKIRVPSQVNLLELPVFYYPEMLNITVNGKAVPYFSVLSGFYLIAGIEPEAGKMNDIHIQFRGLLWANFASQIGWMLWGFFAIYLVLRRFQARKV